MHTQDTTFGYWEGTRPTIIDLCIESQIKHNSPFKLYTKQHIAELSGGQELLDQIENAPVAMQCDVIRVWLLYQFGGLSVDLDTVALQRCDLLERLRESKTALVAGWGRNRTTTHLSNTCIAAKPNCVYFLETHQQNIETIKRNNFRYASCGKPILNEQWNKTPKEFIKLSEDLYSPILNHRVPRYLDVQREDFAHQKNAWWNPLAYQYHLTGRIINQFKKLDEQQLMKGEWFLSMLFRQAFGELQIGRANVILDLIKNVQNPVIAEIGVLHGNLTHNLLQQRRDLTVYAIDHWRKFKGDNYLRITPAKHEMNYQFTRKHLACFGKRAQIVRRSSEAGARGIQDKSLDLVFIDASHEYEEVCKDIKLWLSKVKSGGILAGHDYNCNAFPGVTRAVNEVLGREYISTGDDFTWFARVN